MAIGEEHGGAAVADDYAYSRPAPVIFLLMDGAPVVFEGDATNATAIAEFATASVPFVGQVGRTQAELDLRRHPTRPKMVFYTQKGEVPLVLKLLSVKFEGLVDIYAHVAATRAEVPTGEARLPALVGFVPNTDGELKTYRFVGKSTEGEISNFLDALVPWHGVTIPGPAYPTIQSFLKHQKQRSKMLVLSGEREVHREVRALSGEFKGKILFANCLNTTERQQVMTKSYVGTSIEYAGWTSLFYQNSETQPKEFDAHTVSLLSKILALHSAPPPPPARIAEDEGEPVDIAKARLLALQLRGQGQIAEAQKIEAVVAKWEGTSHITDDSPEPGNAAAAEAELLEMIRILRANGEEDKARKAEETLAQIKAAAADGTLDGTRGQEL